MTGFATLGPACIAVPVASWAVYRASDAEPSGPAVPEVEAGLRRRLSRVARMALRVAFDCCPAGPVRTVYASRHGELARSTAIIQALAVGEEASPTAFSMSVLNAAMGVFSIARGDMSPSTAIAAGAGSLGLGLLEAALQFRSDPSLPVLFVFADEPLPAVYGDPVPPEPPIALAVLLQAPPRAVQGMGHLVWQSADSPPSKSEAEIFSTDTFLFILTEAQGGRWHNSGQWTWRPGGDFS